MDGRTDARLQVQEPLKIPIERVEVPNTGFMRDQPTNCYVLGTRELTIVDPGSEAGIDLLPEVLSRRQDATVVSILLTHAHPDHAAAAGKLKRVFDCPLTVHPGNKPIVGTHLDWSDVDVELDPKEPVVIEDIAFAAIMTPGHAPGHVALWHEESGYMLAGDLVSGNGTIGVFPPHGSMTEYLDSLQRVLELGPKVLFPGHGNPITEPEALLLHYIERRRGREREILELLGDDGARIGDLIPVIYPDILPAYTFPAEATILAHLLKLRSEGQVELDGDDGRVDWWRRSAD
jgi:endoribonuclease LACTB2